MEREWRQGYLGPVKNYWDYEGELLSLNAPYIHYYENGNIKFHGYYIEDGTPINIHTEFHENGNIKSKTVYPSSLGQINIKMGLDDTNASGYYFLKVTKGAKMFSKKLLFSKLK